MNNTATKLELDKKKNKIILPYGKTKLLEWIKYDSRDTSDKAIIMFLSGRNRNNICNLLDITPNYLAKIVFNYYERSYNTEFKQRELKINIPNNFSSWNSKIIYSHLKHIRNKNCQIKGL